ncbi:PspA/IM30 family protein [Neolewinella sp.]|uniref:PspA/IM30 family protein n=1 Tax=Neolewinella sp. TaxID=2993543 RepID=UPI003B525712
MTPPASPKKSFWQRPEGVTGLIFLLAILAGLGFVFTTFAGIIIPFLSTTLGLVVAAVALLTVLFAIVDPRTRTLLSYMYKSGMRKLTGLFVNIDPIGILKSYVEELEGNLQEMRKQIGKIRGQMRHLTTLMETNEKEVKKQLKLAALAKEKGKNQQMILSSRRAARLRESNQKYQVLLTKMEVLNRVLNRMHQNSEVLLEDTRDQVDLRIQERKAIRASHGAMKSAMSVINGDPDQRALFDQAMEAIAEDVATKVGEMERMMELSSDFLASVDLQNGVFADEGLRMLEEWEKKSELLLSEGHIEFDLDDKRPTTEERLDLEDIPRPEAKPQGRGETGNYDQFFQ